MLFLGHRGLHAGFRGSGPFILSLRSPSSVSCRIRSLAVGSPATDKIGHGGNDAVGLLDDHEVPGARDIDDLHPVAQLIPKGVSVARRCGYVIETLDHQERSAAARPPFVLPYASTGRQVRDVDMRPALDRREDIWIGGRR